MDEKQLPTIGPKIEDGPPPRPWKGLEEKLGVSFGDRSLLQQALVHSSYLNEAAEESYRSNERLEFLGDAVLGFIVAGWLHQEYPNAAEGELTRMRSALVRRQTLAEVARALELGSFLYLSKGEEQSGGRKRAVTLANGLEALVGALFLDQGAEATKAVVQRLLSPYLARLSTESRDPKSRLQELLQARKHTRPTYAVLATSGASHERTFTVEVSVAGQPLARGTGPSKRAAEMEAAAQALGILTAQDDGQSEPVPGVNEHPLPTE